MFPLHMLFPTYSPSTSTALRQRETRTCMPSLYQLVSCSRGHALNVLPPPPSFSPDLVPIVCLLFGPLKDALRGTRFEDDESVIRAVRTWLHGMDFMGQGLRMTRA